MAAQWTAAARDMFERALQRRSAAAAVDLYDIVMLDGTADGGQALFDRVLERGSWLADDVADGFEKGGRTTLAAELKARAKEADRTS